jgi:hypothetical protein
MSGGGRVIYVAEFSYDKPAIARVEVEKETDKTFRAKNSDTLLGWIWIGKIVNKGSAVYFEHLHEAATWLMQKCNARAEELEKQAEELRRTAITLRDVVAQHPGAETGAG